MFKILDEVCIPKRGTKYSAYVDLFAREDVTIGAGETKIVKLGVKIDLDKLKKILFKNSQPEFSFAPVEFQNNMFSDWMKSHYLEVALRSSLGVKGLIISNGIGIIDLDFPNEIGLIVHNPVQIREFVQNGNNYTTVVDSDDSEFVIKKGDKVAQCTLKEHKGYLMGYESDVVRAGGFGSTDNKVEAPIFDKPDFFRCNELN